jgi:hypothetical protein
MSLDNVAPNFIHPKFIGETINPNVCSFSPIQMHFIDDKLTESKKMIGVSSLI